MRLDRGGNIKRGKDPADPRGARSRVSHTRVRLIIFPFLEAPPNLCFYKVRGKESKSMDINEPSLMDVAHDTINSTRWSSANRSS